MHRERRQPDRRRAAPGRHHDDAFACPRCASALVELLDARPGARGCWSLTRRCPECEWRGTGSFSADAYVRFDELRRAARAGLVALLERIERARAEQELAWLSRALRGDGPGPDRF